MGEPLGDIAVACWGLVDVGEGVLASDDELSELDGEPDEIEKERPLREVVLMVIGSECFTRSVEGMLEDILEEWGDERQAMGRLTFIRCHPRAMERTFNIHSNSAYRLDLAHTLRNKCHRCRITKMLSLTPLSTTTVPLIITNSHP
jgi:hypothetical protein